MTTIIYTTVMTAALTLLLFMGISLIAGKTPASLKGSIYRESRVILGIIYLILAAEITIVAALNLRHDNINLAIAIAMSTYYIMATLFSLTFTRLLGNKSFFTRGSIIGNTIYCAIYTTTLLGSALLIKNREIIYAILIIAAIAYVVGITLQVVLFFKSYKTAIKKVHNYYYDNAEEILEWIPKSIFNIIIIGFSGVVFSFGNHLAITIYTAYGLCVLIYTYTRMINMVVDIQDYTTNNDTETIIEVITDDETVDEESTDDGEMAEDDSLTTTSEQFKNIEEKIAMWIERKGYLENGVSIQNLSRLMYTNRTYLSKYINTKYNSTFREWIISLRMEEAQRLILNDERSQINEIASKVGFSTSSSFIRAFTRYNGGLSPLKWREANRR